MEQVKQAIKAVVQQAQQVAPKADMPILEYEKVPTVPHSERVAVAGRKVMLLSASSALHVTAHDTAVLDVSKLTDVQLDVLQMSTWLEWKERRDRAEKAAAVLAARPAPLHQPQ